jgi:hypothetical protein
MCQVAPYQPTRRWKCLQTDEAARLVALARVSRYLPVRSSRSMRGALVNTWWRLLYGGPPPCTCRRLPGKHEPGWLRWCPKWCCSAG